MSSSIVAGFFSLENLENYFFTAPRKDERAPPHPTPPQSAHIFGTWTKTCVHEKVPTPPPPSFLLQTKYHPGMLGWVCCRTSCFIGNVQRSYRVCSVTLGGSAPANSHCARWILAENVVSLKGIQTALTADSLLSVKVLLALLHRNRNNHKSAWSGTFTIQWKLRKGALFILRTSIIARSFG